MAAFLEHLNVTVADPQATAALYQRLFGWSVRWQGAAIHGGHTVHIGTADQYIALYRKPGNQVARGDSYGVAGGLNHIAVVVDDLDALETAVRAAGLEPGPRYDYEPGQRFYFHDGDGIEYEAVSYA